MPTERIPFYLPSLFVTSARFSVFFRCCNVHTACSPLPRRSTILYLRPHTTLPMFSNTMDLFKRSRVTFKRSARRCFLVRFGDERCRSFGVDHADYPRRGSFFCTILQAPRFMITIHVHHLRTHAGGCFGFSFRHRSPIEDRMSLGIAELHR